MNLLSNHKSDAHTQCRPPDVASTAHLALKGGAGPSPRRLVKPGEEALARCLLSPKECTAKAHAAAANLPGLKELKKVPKAGPFSELNALFAHSVLAHVRRLLLLLRFSII